MRTLIPAAAMIVAGCTWTEVRNEWSAGGGGGLHARHRVEEVHWPAPCHDRHATRSLEILLVPSQVGRTWYAGGPGIRVAYRSLRVPADPPPRVAGTVTLVRMDGDDLVLHVELAMDDVEIVRGSLRFLRVRAR